MQATSIALCVFALALTAPAQDAYLRAGLRARLPVQPDDSRTVAFADIDQDGDVDAFVGNVHGPDRLWINVGSGVFEDATGRLSPPSSESECAVFLDADLQHPPELIPLMVELWAEQGRRPFPYRVIKIALMPPDRVELRERIAQRFDTMLVEGLVEEVRHLYEKGGLSPEMPSMRAVGYRQVWAYLAGDYDYNTMREKAIIATGQLAKRQMTWLRSENNCNFIDPGTIELPKVLKNIRFLLS